MGYSDHTLGIEACLIAVMKGARVIEKHFTIDKTLPKSADHWLSLDPGELAKLVRETKIIKQSIGTGVKECLKCEKLAKKNARRSIVITKDMVKGEMIKRDCIVLKRPGTGSVSYTHLTLPTIYSV